MFTPLLMYTISEIVLELKLVLFGVAYTPAENESGSLALAAGLHQIHLLVLVFNLSITTSVYVMSFHYYYLVSDPNFKLKPEHTLPD